MVDLLSPRLTPLPSRLQLEEKIVSDHVNYTLTLCAHESEMRIGLLVGNNPIDQVDPLGLEPGPALPMTPQQVQLARQAFGPGGALQGPINQALLNSASSTTLATFQYNAQRGLALAPGSATQMCRLDALGNAFQNKAGPWGALGAGALATGGTALAIGNAPLATSVGILGVGTVGALGAATAGVGFAAGVGIGNIPTGGGGNVNSAIYNAAPGVWNGIGSAINSL